MTSEQKIIKNKVDPNWPDNSATSHGPAKSWAGPTNCAEVDPQ